MEGQQPMSDMRPRRSLRDIARENRGAIGAERPVREEAPQRIPGAERFSKSRRTTSVGLWISVVVLILFLFFVFSVVSAGAKIIVFPKTAPANVAGSYEIFKNAPQGGLQYEVMTIRREGSKQVEATGKTEVEEVASGKITIYNSYDESEQQLVERTRFESPEGHIYRIREDITVPGATEINGSTVPGSVTVTVYADQAGAEYNVPPTRFTIPGFEGDPRFDAFWAESTDSFTGGFIGERLTVSDEDKARAEEEIKSELEAGLLAEMEREVPAGFLLLGESMNVSFSSLPTETGEEGQAIVKVEATAQAMMFDEGALASYIANKNIEDYNGAPVSLAGVGEFTFTLPEDVLASSEFPESTDVTISGDGLIVWDIQKEDLARELANARKSEIDSILVRYPSIDRAEVILRPFWRRSFPDEAKDIQIDIRTQ